MTGNIVRPRIVLLIPNLERGGAERQAVLLAIELRRQGYEVLVVTLHEGGAFAADLGVAGVPLVPLLGEGLSGYLAALPKLVLLLRKRGADHIYSFLPAANVMAALTGLFLPKCQVSWGIRSADMPLAGYGLKTRIAYTLERLLARLPKRIVVNSRAGYNACVLQGFPEDRLRVVPNGFDIAQFRPDSDDRQRVRAEFGIQSGEIAIGLPARLDRVKDHSTFLQAAALLCRTRSNVRFVCLGGAGSTAYSTQLREMAATLGIEQHVVWAGNRTDIAAALNALDIVTLSSVSEGFPNVVGEAMATGVPCVVTNVGDAGYLVGETGTVVPKRDPAAIAVAWDKLFDPEVRQKLGRDARARIVENFNLSRLAERTLSSIIEPL